MSAIEEEIKSLAECIWPDMCIEIGPNGSEAEFGDDSPDHDGYAVSVRNNGVHVDKVKAGTLEPDVPGYDIAGWSRAADKTGGDYFDWQVLPDGQVLISLADVTGHGIGPALMAAVCRAYARATTQEEDLGRYMDRLNQLLIDDMPEGRFITFVGVLIDPKKHQVQMISAGHGPLFRCVHGNGELIESGADGVPLGLIPQNEYGTATKFSLDPGDSVLLITDGLFEWPNAAGESYGLERLRNAIRASPIVTTDEMIQSLYDQSQEFAGNVAQEDDVTIVVIRRLPDISRNPK